MTIANITQTTPKELYQALVDLEIRRQSEGQGRTQEATYVRAHCKYGRNRVKAELRRRGLPVRPPPLCEHCGDSGSLGLSPDGETIYCDCEMGRRRHREYFRLLTDWLREYTDLEVDLLIALYELATIGDPR